MAKRNNRGRKPDNFTIYQLCARAAGRCQFEGCNKLLFTDELTNETFNNSNIAHIVASSPDGPRGDSERSDLLSDKLENLMLLCLDHHKLIDRYPDKYTEDILIAMKKKHEKLIADHCDLIYKTATEIVRFSSLIKGRVPVDISLNKAKDAVIPEKRPASRDGQYINLPSSSYPYKSKQYWEDMVRKLESFFNLWINNQIAISKDNHFSIFPIAPIPLIMKLGYLLGDKIPADIYQKTRNPDSWKWQSDQLTNHFMEDKHIIRQGNRVALVLSLTADVTCERVLNAYDADSIFFIRAEHMGVDCIQSIQDLSEFWHLYQQVCEEIRDQYVEADDICVFPAVPVSAAFEFGRRFMPGIYKKMRIFDDDEGFFETLTIGG